MASGDDSRIGRRAVLGAALGGAAAAAAAVIAAPSSVLGLSGDPMTVGQGHSSTTVTSIECDGANAMSASSNAGDGFWGYSSADEKSGVYGNTGSTTGYGVFGRNLANAGIAALGAPEAALWAAQIGAPLALRVEGKASFSRSGRVAVAAGKSYRDVSVPGQLSGTPLCFANLASYRAGVHVAAVRPNYPSSGKMRIYLNKAVTSPIDVAWVVLG
jgi:hypothetical protein